jgi:hypothetical protein
MIILTEHGLKATHRLDKLPLSKSGRFANLLAIAVPVLIILFITACDALGIEQVVYDDMKILEDGTRLSIGPLDPGTHRLELTATNDGATVKWLGGNYCMGATKAKQSFTETCVLKQTGQLIVENPTTFGMGSSTTVTIKVTKLPDSPN